MKKTVLVLTALVLSGTMGITGLAWAQVQLQQFKPSVKIVFVTSQRYTGNLGGLAGANAKCQQLATAAGLTGTYKAWLADNNSMPTTAFTHSTSPYVLVNGTRIADDWTSLITKPLLHELFTDERNTVVFYNKGYGPEVWTGIYLYHPSGSMSIGFDYYYQSCRGWNSANEEDSGVAGLNYWTMALPPFTTAWSSYERVPCNQNLHLYCFQQ